MRVIDLTMPLYEGMSYGNLFPFETPFRIETIEARMSRQIFIINGEPGTRRQGIQLSEGNVVLQDTAVVDVGPKGPRELITAQDIERGFANADFREGDAVLFRTGWGDDESYRRWGTGYEYFSPHFYDDRTFEKMAEYMIPKKSKLWCHDLPNYTDMPRRWRHWLALKPRPRPWPSPEAKTWIDGWTADERLGPPPFAPGTMSGRLTGINLIGGLVNCGAIKKKRVKLIALPLKVEAEGARVGPCNVVAIEED